MLLTDVGVVVAIILVDLALSGDNALVIGAAAAKLQGRQRRQAITFGGAAAVVLRVALAFLAVLILNIPFIEAIAGVVVFVIALQMVRDLYQAEDDEAEAKVAARFKIGPSSSLLAACVTIAIADLSMSLDNVLAIAALAHGNYLLLAIGLIFSVALLLVASAFVAALIERFPILLYAAGAILAFTAGSMIISDKQIGQYITRWDPSVPGPLGLEVQLLFLALFIGGAVFFWRQHERSHAAHGGA